MQRKFEAVLGGALLKMASQSALKKSHLIRKTAVLPNMQGLKMNYLERPSREGNRRTVVFCHGMADEAKNLAAFISSLEIPSDVRILVPDALGHGEDLVRAKKNPEQFQQPTALSILESTVELLQVLNVESCNVFGYSMGGVLAYFLRYKLPSVVHKTVLLSPSFESCLDSTFIDDFVQGRKNHWCFESRDDAKRLFRDLSVPHRRKNNPIPKFFLEAIWRLQVAQTPRGHYRTMLEGFLKDLGNDSELKAQEDIDLDSPRLVLWADHDFICNHEKGKAFFANSSSHTTFETIPDCGHMFHSDGTFILDLVRPQVAAYLLDFE